MEQLRASDLEKTGHIWLRNAISEHDLSLFDITMPDNAKAGQRLAASVALKSALSENGSLLRAIRKYSPAAAPVRVVAFDKSQETNWGVPWHQDRIIAVSEKADVSGYTNWTKKSGVCCVVAPCSRAPSNIH